MQEGLLMHYSSCYHGSKFFHKFMTTRLFHTKGKNNVQLF